MDREALYKTWAPTSAAWSLWAKPVLFVHAGHSDSYEFSSIGEVAVSWAPNPVERVALVVDLPGAESVAAGIALARSGYRPVPIFNAAPGRNAAVPVEPIIAALAEGETMLTRLSVADDAPPAFLLDANRMRPAIPLRPGVFDNRSVVFPQDFPSAGMLLRSGCRRVILLQRAEAIQNDLQHVLRRWQEAGLVIWLKRFDDAGAPSPVTVPRPSRFRSVFYRVATLIGLRRNSAGAFGSTIPESSGGGFG